MVTMVPLGVGPEINTLRTIAPGVVWVAALLAVGVMKSSLRMVRLLLQTTLLLVVRTQLVLVLLLLTLVL